MSKRREHTLSSLVFRWSGLGAALAGVLFAVWGYVHKEGDVPSYYSAAAHVLSIVVPLLFLVGLIGFYVRCGRQMGWLGESGFILGFTSSVWGAAHPFVEVSAWYGAWYTYFLERGWPLAVLHWNPWLLASLTVIGVAILRSEAFKKWGLLLLTMGLFGWVYCFTDDVVGIFDARSIHAVFGVLFSLSWVSFGYALWSSRGVSSSISTGQH